MSGCERGGHGRGASGGTLVAVKKFEMQRQSLWNPNNVQVRIAHGEGGTKLTGVHHLF